ncbi:MAG: Cas9 inhibitor AcrIIA9 family protein [Ruminococcus flavefaciens]|nr:Cas9 inhibitor AcrIIA9 family protein [Ruminococcus flavefaciens]
MARLPVLKGTAFFNFISVPLNQYILITETEFKQTTNQTIKGVKKQMVNLNLKAEGKPQELILAYLQENASEVLAEKINSGVPIEKDGKQLINKKDLKSFMAYASAEARKLAAKGENSACIEDNVVYGWAIHYFEEDSIEGTLYNADGTEYKPVTKATPKPAVTPVKTEPQKPKAEQSSLFDMLNASDQTGDQEPEDNSDDEDDGEELNNDYTPEELQELADEAEESETTESPEDRTAVEKTDKPQDITGGIKATPLYKHYLAIQKQYADSVLFLRIGDFYEVLGNNALKVAEPLNLTITGRDVGLEERVPMVGVPYHAFDPYLAKLIKAGFKIAVAEDIGDVTVFPQYDEEEIEEMSEQQMREFDSYVDEETEELPTVSKIVGSIDDSEDDNGTEILDAEAAKAFDKEALCILSVLFDGEITLA